MGHKIFISHKHSDAPIAGVVAKFIEARSCGQVSVHLSSDPKYSGPRLGKSLNQELCNALYDCDLLILIYTSADEDWSYCMFECGVATDPKSPHTNIIVFQCGQDVPTPFADQLRVNARKEVDIRKFTKAFFTDATFFPDSASALAPTFSESQCDNAGVELFTALGMPGILPPLVEQPVEDVPAWPLLRLQIASDSIDGMSSKAHAVCEKLLLEEAVIIESDNRAPLLFGMKSIPPAMRFGSLINTCVGQTPGAMPVWLTSVVVQVLCNAERRLADIRWESFKETNGDRWYAPIVTNMRRVPSEGKVHIDLYFFELSNLTSATVDTHMIDLSSIYLKRLTEATRSMKLVDLRNEMNESDKERLPILSEDDRPLFMVHRSMLERYMLDQQLEGNKLESLSVGNFLDMTSKNSLDSTFATLAPTASLADAQKTMIGTMRDIFVTKDGSCNAPVLGWLSNVRLARSL